MPINQDVIKRADVVRANVNTTCVTAPFIDDAVQVEIKPNVTATNNTVMVGEVKANEIIEMDADDDDNAGNRTRRHVMSYEEDGDL